jgi:hypothetical protein
MVERDVVQLRLIGEQVTGLAEQRAGGRQHGAQHPGVEVVRIGRGVVADELAAVRGSAAHDGVDLECGERVGHAPELGGQLVIEGRHDELEARPSAQGRVATEQPPHEGHRRTAQQQAGPAGVAFGPKRRERVLDDGGQLGIRPHEIGELVDHHGNALLAAQRQERVDGGMPRVEDVRRGGAEMIGQHRAQPVE